MIKKGSRRDLDAQGLPASATYMVSLQNKLYFAGSTPTLKTHISSFRWIHSVTPSPRNQSEPVLWFWHYTKWLFRLSEMTFVSARHWTVQNLLRQVKSHVTHTLCQYFFREATLSTRNVCKCIYISSGLYVESFNIKTDNKMQVFAFSDTAQKLFHRCNNAFLS